MQSARDKNKMGRGIKETRAATRLLSKDA